MFFDPFSKNCITLFPQQLPQGSQLVHFASMAPQTICFPDIKILQFFALRFHSFNLLCLGMIYICNKCNELWKRRFFQSLSYFRLGRVENSFSSDWCGFKIYSTYFENLKARGSVLWICVRSSRSKFKYLGKQRPEDSKSSTTFRIKISKNWER